MCTLCATRRNRVNRAPLRHKCARPLGRGSADFANTGPNTTLCRCPHFRLYLACTTTFGNDAQTRWRGHRSCEAPTHLLWALPLVAGRLVHRCPLGCFAVLSSALKARCSKARCSKPGAQDRSSTPLSTPLSAQRQQAEARPLAHVNGRLHERRVQLWPKRTQRTRVHGRSLGELAGSSVPPHVPVTSARRTRGESQVCTVARCVGASSSRCPRVGRREALGGRRVARRGAVRRGVGARAVVAGGGGERWWRAGLTGSRGRAPRHRRLRALPRRDDGSASATPHPQLTPPRSPRLSPPLRGVSRGTPA